MVDGLILRRRKTKQIIPLYNEGVEAVSITTNGVKNADNITLATSGTGGGWNATPKGMRTDLINLTDIKTLKLRALVSMPASSIPTMIIFHVGSTTAYYNPATTTGEAAEATQGFNALTTDALVELELDVTALNGSYYVKVTTNSSNATVQITGKVYEVWGEK